MVTAVTNLGRSGVSDWLIQRVTALVMLAYVIFLVVYVLITPELSYADWQGLFGQLWMRIFSLITLLSIVAHAWIGLWIVLTDYITEYMMGGKAVVLRLLALLGLAAVALTYTLWGIEIIWGF